jgi:hypothetical protein
LFGIVRKGAALKTIYIIVAIVFDKIDPFIIKPFSAFLIREYSVKPNLTFQPDLSCLTAGQNTLVRTYVSHSVIASDISV